MAVENGLAFLKTVSALATAGKALAASATDAKLNTQLIDFQTALIQINSDAVALQIENQGLRNDIEALKSQARKAYDWAAERLRYKLIAPWDGHGSVLYALRKDRAEGETAHWLCPACFERGSKSMLQGFDRDPKQPGSSAYFICTEPACKAKISSAFNNAG
jgi:hypothetical protein